MADKTRRALILANNYIGGGLTGKSEAFVALEAIREALEAATVTLPDAKGCDYCNYHEGFIEVNPACPKHSARAALSSPETKTAKEALWVKCYGCEAVYGTHLHDTCPKCHSVLRVSIAHKDKK